MPANRLASTWLPVVVWAGVIFALSSVPSLSSGLGSWDVALRKLAHVSEYAVLGALLRRGLPAGPAVLAGVLYAVSDELHQTFVPGRHGAPLDVAIDGFGIVIGVLLVQRARR